MPSSSTSTTIRVSKPVRDELGALAAAAHLTLDELLRRLARAERQRIIADEQATYEPTEADRAVIAAGLGTVTRHAVG
ncbi:MAG TPA: hypothetical protein PLV68_09500 [Ilumatobacteraceae bacterium]|nr:hypothetical protein [Ilumatobacteraceae bacterium]